MQVSSLASGVGAHLLLHSSFSASLTPNFNVTQYLLAVSRVKTRGDTPSILKNPLNYDKNARPLTSVIRRAKFLYTALALQAMKAYQILNNSGEDGWSCVSRHHSQLRCPP